MSKSGIVNVRMVITEEKILSNIDKVQKLINPKSKKQIVQLEEDTYFKDMVESIKTYLIEYPNKKNFPAAVYKSAYGLVEFATNQFEENTKRIEELIRQREKNIVSAGYLKDLLGVAIKESTEISDEAQKAKEELDDNILNALNIVEVNPNKEAEEYKNAIKLIKARINNLESNLHIEIDMERIEDRSKALSYIGIEVADALRDIPTPVEEIKEEIQEEAVVEAKIEEPVVEQMQFQSQYEQETRFEVKPSLWQKIKNSKIGRAVSYVLKVRVVLDVPNALPEGRGENC